MVLNNEDYEWMCVEELAGIEGEKKLRKND